MKEYCEAVRICGVRCDRVCGDEMVGELSLGDMRPCVSVGFRCLVFEGFWVLFELCWYEEYIRKLE